MQPLRYLKIFRLSKEYSAQIILDGNNQSHKRIVPYINNLALNPICQAC